MGPPSPMERSWIHPSELPSLKDAGHHDRKKRRPSLIAAATLLSVLGGIAIAAIATTGPSKPAETAVVRSSPPALREQIVGVVDAKGQTLLGVVVGNGAMVALASRDPMGSSAVITTMAGTKETGSVVATDAALGLSIVKVPTALASPTRPSTTLQAMATSRADVITGTNPMTLLRSVSTLRSNTTTIGNQEIGILETSVTPHTPGIVTTLGGIPEALLIPHVGTHIAIPLTTVDQRAAMIVRGLHRGWLQISVTTASQGGVLVSKIGAASAHALSIGDRITAINDQAIAGIGDLLDNLYGAPAGTSVVLTLTRGEASITETVVLAPHP